MRISLSLLAGVAVVSLGSAAQAGGPSFDCAKASTPTEYAICDNPKLAELDLALAEAYRAARARNVPGLKARQKAWLAERDRCRSNVACLEQQMRARLAELGGQQPGGGGTPPAGGGGGGGISTPGPGGGGGTPPPAGGGGGGISTPGPGGGGGTRPPAGGGGGGGISTPGPGAGIAQSAGGPDALTGFYCPSDRVALALDQSTATLAFNLSLFNDVSHFCGTGPLVAQWTGVEFVALDGACTLTLSPGETSIRISATPMGACQAQYCGARAVIPVLDVPYSSKSSRISDPMAWNWMENGC